MFYFRKILMSKNFRTEPNNLTKISSYRYNGLVHKKALGVVSAKKGFTFVIKKGKYNNCTSKDTVRVKMKAGLRRSLKKLRNLINVSKYRSNLKQAALRKASIISTSAAVKKAE